MNKTVAPDGAHTAQVRLKENFNIARSMQPYANRLRLRLVHLDLADPRNKKRLEDSWRKMIDLLIKKKIREDVAQQAVAQALDIAADHQLEVLRRDQNFQELKRSRSDLKRLGKQLEALVHAISKLPPRAKGELNKIVLAQDWRSFGTEKFGELIHEMICVLAKSSPACIATTALSAVIEPLRASRHPAVAQIARTAPPAVLDLWETIPAETRTQVEAAMRAWAAPIRRPAIEFLNHLISLLEKFRPQLEKKRRPAIEGHYGRRLAKIWQELGLHVGRAFDGVNDRHVESNFQRFGRLALTAVGDESRMSTRQIENLKSKLLLRR
jgi:hypothetical protein